MGATRTGSSTTSFSGGAGGRTFKVKAVRPSVIHPRVWRVQARPAKPTPPEEPKSRSQQAEPISYDSFITMKSMYLDILDQARRGRRRQVSNSILQAV